MDETTARQVLGVSGDAGEEEIREAFRKRAREEHPDQSDDPEATERFQKITKARAVLLEDRPESVAEQSDLASDTDASQTETATGSTDDTARTTSRSASETSSTRSDSSSETGPRETPDSASAGTDSSVAGGSSRSKTSPGPTTDDTTTASEFNATVSSGSTSHEAQANSAANEYQSASWSRPQATSDSPLSESKRYWGQMAISLLAAIGVGYVLLEQGYGDISTALIGILSYLVVRWGLKWLHRTLSLYTSKSQYTQRCQNCLEEHKRRPRDWIMECQSCGWKPGLPVLRWVTHSMPAQQLRQTVFGPGLFVAVVAAGLVVSGATAGMAVADVADMAPDIDPEEFVESGGTEPSDIATNASEMETTPTPDSGTSADTNLAETPPESAASTPIPRPGSMIDETKVETKLLELIKAKRTDQNLEALEELEVLHDKAESHSKDMQERDFVSHTNPDGEGPRDRVEGIDECMPRSTTVSVREIIADGPVGEGVSPSDSLNSFDTNNADGIATYLVDAWMNSGSSRAIILEFGLDYVGVGVDITNEKFVATVKFC